MNTYIKGLNSLRFLLAMLVLVGHARLNLVQYGIIDYENTPILYKGGLAVTFFFVLSGFILTHLAINELTTTGILNLRFFFLRRILRIFPLYYLAVLCGYVLLGVVYPILHGKPYLSFPLYEGIAYHICLLPNFITAKYGTNIGSFYALWSIGVEEQFYLCFPFVFPFIWRQKRHILWILSLTALFFWAYSQVFSLNSQNHYSVQLRFLQSLQFHFMFLGCAAAVIFHYYKDIIWAITKKTAVYCAIWLAFIAVLVGHFFAADPYFILHSLLFCCLIFAVSNPFLAANNFLERAPLQYLGSISYGIYIFHPILSYFLRFAMEKSTFLLKIIQYFPLSYYFLLSATTIFVAHLSFQYFETYFLRFKTKFT
jgi:peptidoglycan/LPS O-acetylase OafA/YrhL